MTMTSLYLGQNTLPYRSGYGKCCSVISCKNNQKLIYCWNESLCELHPSLLHKDCPCLQPFKLHCFPKNEEIRRQWIANLQRKNFVPSKYSVVCSNHFIDGRPTPKNCAPQLHLGYNKKVKHGRKPPKRKATEGTAPKLRAAITVDANLASDSAFPAEQNDGLVNFPMSSAKQKCKSTGRTCAVIGCRNTNRKLREWKAAICELHGGQLHIDCPCLIPYGFHQFPHKHENLKHQWMQALNRKDYVPGKYAAVCSKHFIDGRPTKLNPVPQMHLGYETKIPVPNYELVSTKPSVKGRPKKVKEVLQLHLHSRKKAPDYEPVFNPSRCQKTYASRPRKHEAIHEHLHHPLPTLSNLPLPATFDIVVLLELLTEL